MSLPQSCVRFGLVLCLAVWGLMGASSVVAAEPEILFDPPPAVTIRKTDGSAARGNLLSIDPESVKLRILNGSQIELDLDRVRSVQSSGGARRGQQQFEWRPSTETFGDLVGRAQSMSGATVVGESSSVARRRSVAASEADAEEDDDHPRGPGRKKNRSPFGGGTSENGTGGVLNLNRSEDDISERRSAKTGGPNNANPFGNLKEPEGRTPRSPDKNSVEPEESQDGGGSLVGAIEILVCGNCEKDLPAGFRSGNKCPHCGQVAVFAEDSAELAANDPAAQSNPFAAPGGQSAKQPFAAPASTAAAQPAVVQPAAASGQGLSMSGLPIYAKIGIFLGFVLVGWFIVQRR